MGAIVHYPSMMRLALPPAPTLAPPLALYPVCEGKSIRAGQQDRGIINGA